MSDETTGAGFNASYRVLKETADWLSSQKEPDIDQLVPRVETAMRAYQVCKDRLERVQATLGGLFESDAATPEPTSEPETPARSRRPSRPDGPDEFGSR